MSDARRPPDATGPGEPAGIGTGGTRGRKRLWRRVILASLASVLAIAGAGLLVGYEGVNHLASRIPRIHVAHLVASNESGGGPVAGGENILITGSQWGPTGSPTQPPSPPNRSGLIMILHLYANQHGGGVVSLPPQALVHVPGHGPRELWDASRFGGPSLLVQTVENLTRLPINHYARVDLNHVAALVNAIGGVNVTLPAATTSFGHTFTAGVNHLSGILAIYYARQPSLDQTGKLLRQQSLIRAVIRKIANDHLLTNPATMVRVLRSLTRMLTVDSNFTNGQLAALAKELGALPARNVKFLTAPSHPSGVSVELDEPASSQLWQAIRQDALSAFASRYPGTVTPESVP